MEAVATQLDVSKIVKLLQQLAQALEGSSKSAAADYFIELSVLLKQQAQEEQVLTLKYLAESTQLFQFVDFSDSESNIFDKILTNAAKIVGNIGL